MTCTRTPVLPKTVVGISPDDLAGWPYRAEAVAPVITVSANVRLLIVPPSGGINGDSTS